MSIDSYDEVREWASPVLSHTLQRRHIDKEKFERADREARKLIEAERQAREAKTARLRELRLSGSRGQP